VVTTIEQAFRQFASNLELTDRQAGLISTRRANVVDVLRKQISLHPTDVPKVIGSWDRSTMTKYLSEGDVDVLVVLHYGKNKQWNTSDGTVACLDRVRSILADAYRNTTIRRDRNCITMRFSEFRLDVVPAFRYEQGYYEIPDSVRKEWVPTNPFEFAKGVTRVNKNNLDGKFVPLIKMMKSWNRNVGWPIRSFHLECMMYHRYKTYEQGYTYPSMLKVFFEALPGYLGGACYDPVQGDRLDTYLDNDSSPTLREIAIRKAKKAATDAAEAYEDQEKYAPVVSIGEWKALMGDFFPSYG
jgi:hypothetical protein